MLKTFTLSLSLSLALALGFCGVSQAGHHANDGCATCGIASPQGPMVSPQGPVVASPQGECYPAEKKKCHLLSGMKHAGNKMSCGFNGLCAKMKPKPKCYTYEWVLKKKRVKGGCGGNACGSPACETCAVYPSGQGMPSPQGGYAAPQSYGSPQAGYGSPQAGYSAPQYGSGQYGSGQYGSGQYGSGQVHETASVGTMAPAAPVGGDEAPPAPEMSTPNTPKPSIPPVPPAPPAPGATSSLLFSTPSGN